MSLELSRFISKIGQSPTLGMVQAINQRKAENKSTIAFNIGEPDFDTPAFINEAIITAINEGKTRYVDVAGIKELRQQISIKLKEDNNLDYNAEQIIVTTGAKQALYDTFLTILNQGDEVIIPTPCWVSYEEMIKSVGAEPIFLKTDENFLPNIEELKRLITSDTKAILLNTPNNPTGAVYPKELLEQIGELAIEHKFYIVADEIYEKLIYDGKTHISIGSLKPEYLAQTITINGFAKAYAMTGYRIGYVAAPLKIAKAIANLQGHMTSNSTTPVQYGAVTALKEGLTSIEYMRDIFSERRKLIFKLLDEVENISYQPVYGAFYIMIDFEYFFNKSYENYTINDMDDMSLFLLEVAGIALVTGKAFHAPNHLRFSYSTSEENIIQGIKQMQEALALLK